MGIETAIMAGGQLAGSMISASGQRSGAAASRALGELEAKVAEQNAKYHQAASTYKQHEMERKFDRVDSQQAAGMASSGAGFSTAVQTALNSEAHFQQELERRKAENEAISIRYGGQLQKAAAYNHASAMETSASASVLTGISGAARALFGAGRFG